MLLCGAGEQTGFLIWDTAGNTARVECKKRNIARRRGSTREGTSQPNIAPYIYGKGKYMTS